MKTEPKGFTFQVGDLVVLSVRDSFVTGVRFVRARVYLPDCLLRPLPMLRLNVRGRGALCWMPAAAVRIETRRSGCWGGTRGVGQTVGCAPRVPRCPHLLLRLFGFHSCGFDSCATKLGPKAGVRHGQGLESLA